MDFDKSIMSFTITVSLSLESLQNASPVPLKSLKVIKTRKIWESEEEPKEIWLLYVIYNF